MTFSFTCPHCGVSSDLPDDSAGRSMPCRSCGKFSSAGPGDRPAVIGPQDRNTAPSPAAPQKSGTILGMPTAVFVIVLLATILFVVVVCGGILMALLLPAVQAAREHARQVACESKLHNIHIAIEAYYIEHDHYPPAYTVDANGQRLHSWRTLLLPYFGYHEIYDQIRLDEPWDSPHNRQFRDADIMVYQCPSAAGGEADFTNYVVVVGPEMIFQGSTPTHKEQVKDGLTQTVLVVETVDTDIHWMEPKDLDFEKMVFRVNGSPDDVSSRHPGGVNAMMADGQVRFFSDTIDPMVWRALLTPSGPRSEYRLQFPF